jgi:hypothetical protein
MFHNSLKKLDRVKYLDKLRGIEGHKRYLEEYDKKILSKRLFAPEEIQVTVQVLFCQRAVNE